MTGPRLRVLHLAPDLGAVSGISTHVGLLLRSPLADEVHLRHFRAGSEGLAASALRLRWQLATSPLRLLLVLLTWRPDVVHVNTATERKALWRDVVYVLLARLAGRAVVLQVHGGPTPEVLASERPASLRVLALALRAAHRVVVLGELDRRRYAAVAPRVAFVVVPNAVAVRPSAPTREPGLLGGGPLRLVFAGRLTEAKGLFEAVDAVARLHDGGTPLTWDVAGSGPDAERLRAAVSARGLDGVVRLLGPVFGADKQDLFDACDVLLFPSWAEGLPYALLEALEAGLVAVTCPVGAVPDVVVDRESALLVPVRDTEALVEALRWVHEHREQARAVAAAGRRRVEEQYSLARLSGQLRGLYEELAPARGAGRPSTRS